MKMKWMGQVPYNEALKIMENSTEDEVMGLEHPSVVTLGRRGSVKNDLTDQFSSDIFELFQVERGGQATLHSPGQLVIYPLLTLKKYNLGVRSYVALIEEATIEMCNALGVSLFKKCDEPGLYTKNGKLAFFGVRVKNGKTQHGLALNVSNNLQLFEAICSCGRARENFDSLENQGVHLDTEQLFAIWCQKFTALIFRQQEEVPLTKLPLKPNVTNPQMRV